MKAHIYLEKKAFPNLLSPAISGVKMLGNFSKNLIHNNGFGNTSTLNKVIGRGSLLMGGVGMLNSDDGARKALSEVSSFKGVK